MRKRVLTAVVFLALAGWASACRSTPSSGAGSNTPPGLPPASRELSDFFETKLHAEWDAISRKDKKALGDLLDENYVAVEADREGERFKWKVLSELDRSSVAKTTLSSLKVTSLGPDSAFLRYEVFMEFPPGSTQRFLKVLVGEIWVRKNGDWKALHYQETAVK